MTGELCKYLKRQISIIYKFFKQIEEEETFLKLTLWGQHYFDTKTMQRLLGKKQQMKIFMNTDANINKILASQIQAFWEGSSTWSSGIYF